MELALPFVCDFGHGDNSYLVALTYNLVVGKRVDMVEHKAGRGLFDSEAVAKGFNGFDPKSSVITIVVWAIGCSFVTIFCFLCF